MSSSALKAAVTGQVATPPKTIFTYLDDPRVKTGIAAVAGKFLQADRMLRLCVNAVKKTPRLLECDPQTVLGAMMASAALGLEPNTVQQQAFLIPYKRRANINGRWVDVYDCQFQVGARGFVTLAYRSPQIKRLFAETRHENDLFEHMQGSQTFLRYSKAMSNRGAALGSFCHVMLEGGEETMCVLPMEEIEKIRGRSETYRALLRNIESAENAKERARAEGALAETPWVMWFDDMAAKSAIKKHAKQLPLATGDAMAVAAELDSGSDVGNLNLRAMTDVDTVRAVVGDGMDAPQLENDPSEVIDQVSGEVFGTREREEAQRSAAPPPPPVTQAAATRGRRAAGPAPAPATTKEPEQKAAEDAAPDGAADTDESAKAFAEYVARVNGAQSLTEAEMVADEAEQKLGPDVANRIRQATGLEPK